MWNKIVVRSTGKQILLYVRRQTQKDVDDATSRQYRGVPSSSREATRRKSTRRRKLLKNRRTLQQQATRRRRARDENSEKDQGGSTIWLAREEPAQ
jgi:hypothetical protein